MLTIQEKLVLQLKQHEKYPNKDVVAVFQPHTFSRTQAFLDEFADALSKADHVFLCEIFGSIRENTGELTIQDLINRIDGSALIDENSIDVLEKFDNAVILFMGAGDIQKSKVLMKKNWYVKRILICLYIIIMGIYN